MFTGGAHVLLLSTLLSFFSHSSLLALLHPGFIRALPCCSLHDGNAAHWHLHSLRPSPSDYRAGRTLGSAHLLNCKTLPGSDREAENISVLSNETKSIQPPFNNCCPSTSNLPQITVFHFFSGSSDVIKKMKCDAGCWGRTWIGENSAIESESLISFSQVSLDFL